MGDGKDYILRVDFDRRLRLEFHGAKVTSDAGLLVYRELDDVFRLTEMAAGRLFDSRTGSNTQHTMIALVRQAVLGRPAGYEVHHAGYVVFQMAEVAVPRELFGKILERIGRLRPRPRMTFALRALRGAA